MPNRRHRDWIVLAGIGAELVAGAAWSANRASPRRHCPRLGDYAARKYNQIAPAEGRMA